MARLLVGVVLSILLWGCDGSHSMDAVLTRAEQMIESAPDSALLILQSIEQPQRLRRKGAARYALVRTMAEVQCFHTITSDSLIRIAVDYYGDDSALQSALSYYCWGCVCASKGNDELAATAYLRAKSLFPDKHNRYYGLSSTNLAMLFYRNGMYEKALEEFYEASEFLSSSGSVQDNASFTYNVGTVYLAMGNYDMAYIGFSHVAHDKSETVRPYRLRALHQLATTAYQQRKYSAANYYINQCFRFFSPEELFAGVYATKGDVLLAHEELDSALHYYRKGLECPYELHSYASIYNGMANVFRYQNRADSVKYYQKLEVQQNKLIAKNEITDEMYTVLSSFQVEQALANIEEERRRQEFLHYRNVTILLCVIIVLVVLLAWLFRCQKHRYSYFMRFLTMRHPFLSAVFHPHQGTHFLEYTRRSPSLQLSLNASFSDILQTCAESFKATALYDELFSLQVKESEIVQLHYYGHSEELRESLFLHFSPIIHELCRYVRLSDKHIIHCLCRYLGVPTATIAYCLHTTVRSLSKDKTRLQQKLPENYAAILLGNSVRRGRPKSL